MRRQGPRCLPARFSYPETESRPEGWGRLMELGAAEARLLTRFRLARGERLHLHFELPGGERFEGLEAEVRAARRDEDGYFSARLAVLRREDAVRLRRALRALLSGG